MVTVPSSPNAGTPIPTTNETMISREPHANDLLIALTLLS